MHLHPPLRALTWLAAIITTILCQVHAKPQPREIAKPQIRIVCATSLDEEQEVILAETKDGENLEKITQFQLKASTTTEWLPVKAGDLHLAIQDGGTLKSICRFTHPVDSGKCLVFLVADKTTQTYNARFIDPKQAKFDKNTFLILNCSTARASVFLGPDEKKIEADQHVVARPTLESNGMFRILVTRPGKDDKDETCFDAYTKSDPNNREILLLLPDEKLGLRVINIPLLTDFK